MGATVWVAAYAAIVSTAALALEIRRWIESGPKIFVRATPNMTMVDGREQTSGLLVVNVTNRGDTPATVTHFGILEFPSKWARLVNSHSQSFVVLHPQPKGAPPNIPAVLRPGEQWTGIAHPRPDVTGDIQTGRFWAAIYTTDRDKPYLAHIPKPKPVSSLENAREF